MMNFRMRSRSGDLFFDLRADHFMPYVKITQSKPLGNGNYRRETIFIDQSELLEFKNAVDKAVRYWNLVPEKKYSIEEVRNRHGNAYLPWTDDADAYLVRLYKVLYIPVSEN